MAEKFENAKPTRMELLKIRKRKMLAKNGHELLSEKKDALINEFFKVLDQRKELKYELDELISTGYRTLQEAHMLMGGREVKSISEGAPKMEDLDVVRDSVMGVRVPSFDVEIPDQKFYGYADTSVKLDESVENFRKVLKAALKLAVVEGKLDKLADEIEKAKRRVNALEYIYIPKLDATITYIERQIEEREREDFFRRKKIKAIMERREKDEAS